MVTKTELASMKMIASSMTVNDLRWQINNPAMVGNDPDVLQVFKDELASRSGFQKLGDVANRVVGNARKY